MPLNKNEPLRVYYHHHLNAQTQKKPKTIVQLKQKKLIAFHLLKGANLFALLAAYKFGKKICPEETLFMRCVAGLEISSLLHYWPPGWSTPPAMFSKLSKFCPCLAFMTADISDYFP